MTDIVERLRSFDEGDADTWPDEMNGLLREAATTIATLRAQLATAVEGLQAINNERTVDYLLGDKDIARKTLAAIKGGTK